MNHKKGELKKCITCGILVKGTKKYCKACSDEARENQQRKSHLKVNYIK